MKYKLRIPPIVEKAIVHLPPNLKKKIRSALEEIRENPYMGKTLRDELKGLWSYRVSRYRIVYRIHARCIEIQIIDIEARNIIYERVFEMLRVEHR